MTEYSDEALFDSHGLGAKGLNTTDTQSPPSSSISFSFPKVAQAPETAPPQSNTDILLRAKIASALNRHGYDEAVISKVEELVARNTLTVHSTQVESALSRHDEPASELNRVSEQVHLLLKGMLDPSVERSRTVKVNSNEPVLLVSVSEELGEQAAKHAINEIRRQIQSDWSVWPVRVWAGAFVTAEGQSQPEGFELSLLNVVNTDIGGPSMVQLLDEPCGASVWNRWCVKEAWNGREFLSREERKLFPTDTSEEPCDFPADNASEHSIETVGSSLASLESQGERERSVVPSPALEPSQNAPIDESPEETAPNPLSEEAGVAEGVIDAEPVASDAGNDYGEGGSLEEWMHPQPERDIQHPTWDRDHDQLSLLDMIRSQASGMAGAKSSAATNDPEPSEHKDASPKDSDDDFEVVETII